MIASKYWSTAWRVLAVSVPIGITISDVIGYVAKVEGSSMQPALNPKWPKSDYVFLHSWPIARNAFEEIQRGDIVSLISPKNPKQRLIKRVIALQGDVVESKGGFLEIPDGHCWVEGDHRTTSYDSNSFGPVALGLIKSRACWVVWPPNCVELKFPGSVLKNSLCVGDCDNDGFNELIVGNATGDLSVFRGDKCVYTASDLGPIGAVAVGDLFSIGKNVLVVITIDGWCHIFDVEADAMQQKKDEIEAGPQFLTQDYYLIFPFHSQKIPPNVKTLHLGDVNEDGLVEMVVGLTDRVLRTYQWRTDITDENKAALQEDRNGKVKEEEDSRSDTSDVYEGRLYGINKWEFASQIGSVALHEVDNVLSIVVGQPGCNVTIITEKSEPCLSENSVETLQDADGVQMSGSTGSFVVRNESPSDNIVIQHHQYNLDSVQNSSISTEVVGNLASLDRKSHDRLGIATLDGTLLIAKNDSAEWSLQVDNQILSLNQLNGKLIACSWNGDTYLIDGKETVRFHFEDSVAAFYAGSYAFPDDLLSEEHNLVNKYSFIYVTFDERIYVYPIDLV